jgi:cobalamin-dependent methionine synthase I
MIAETYKGIRPAQVIPCPDHLENLTIWNTVEEEIGVLTLTEVWQCNHQYQLLFWESRK